MKGALAYVALSSRRQLGRVSLTACGLGLSFAAVAYAYGLAGVVDGSSTQVLSLVLGDALIWMVPRDGVRVDPETGGILPVGALSPQAIAAANELGTGGEWSAVRVLEVTVGGSPGVLYCDSRRPSAAGLAVSQLNHGLRRTAAGLQISLGDHASPVSELRSDLPPQIAVGPLGHCGASQGQPQRDVAWLVSSASAAESWAVRSAASKGLEVRSTPAKASAPGAKAVLVLIRAKAGRFDPYSFRTKFSALVLHGALAEAFGWGARTVFAMGLLLALSSALIGVAERKDEIAWFVVNGFLPQMTVVLFLEALLLSLLAWLGGASVALGLLAWRTPSTAAWSFVAGNALGIGVAFTPLALLVATLVPAQSAAARTPAAVVRATV